MSIRPPRSLARRLTALWLSAALAACGGGSGSGGTPLPEVDAAPVAMADPGSPLAADWHQGVFAEIFVRAYKDSDGDGIGDLKGLAQQLDYLRELGVSGIWLMPVTRSQDHDHGYAVADYRDIENDYGSLADFDALLREAHARGIGVIVDYVMNHSAAQHPAFVNARAGVSNPYRDWYLFEASKPSGWSIFGADPWHAAPSGYYFGAFWDQMPDFDLRSTEVVAFHHDNLRFWLNRGVDGFRFDAVGHLVENGPNAWENQPENHALMGAVRQLVGGYARRTMVCEAPSDPIGFAASSACGRAFAFGHQYDLVAAAKGDAGAVQAVADYFASAPASMATFASNHDSFAGQRLWDQLDGDQARYRLAAATYLLQPGTPFVYYGEEIGMAGAAVLGGDPKLRTPMSWTSSSDGFSTGTPFRPVSANIASQNVAAQQTDANSLLSFYKAVIALRNAHPSLRAGTHLSASASGTMLDFQRALGDERALVVINYGTGNAIAALSGLPPNATLANAFPPGGIDLATDAAGEASLGVPALSLRVFVHRP